MNEEQQCTQCGKNYSWPARNFEDKSFICNRCKGREVPPGRPAWQRTKKARLRLAGRPPLACDICRTRIDKKTAHWDHDHKTGEFRGWLCLNCNVGLGHFKDSPQLLVMASKYLKRQVRLGLEVVSQDLS